MFARLRPGWRKFTLFQMMTGEGIGGRSSTLTPAMVAIAAQRIAAECSPQAILVSDLVSFEGSRQEINSVYRDIADEGLALWQDGRLDPGVAEQVCR